MSHELRSPGESLLGLGTHLQYSSRFNPRVGQGSLTQLPSYRALPRQILEGLFLLWP